MNKFSYVFKAMMTKTLKRSFNSSKFTKNLKNEKTDGRDTSSKEENKKIEHNPELDKVNEFELKMINKPKNKDVNEQKNDKHYSHNTNVHIQNHSLSEFVNEIKGSDSFNSKDLNQPNKPIEEKQKEVPNSTSNNTNIKNDNLKTNIINESESSVKQKVKENDNIDKNKKKEIHKKDNNNNTTTNSSELKSEIKDNNSSKSDVKNKLTIDDATNKKDDKINIIKDKKQHESNNNFNQIENKKIKNDEKSENTIHTHNNVKIQENEKNLKLNINNESKNEIKKQDNISKINPITNQSNLNKQDTAKKEGEKIVKTEIKKDVKSEVKKEDKVDVKNEVKKEEKVEVKSEVKKEAKVEVKSEVTKEVKNEVIKELKNEVIKEVNVEAKGNVEFKAEDTSKLKTNIKIDSIPKNTLNDQIDKKEKENINNTNSKNKIINNEGLQIKTNEQGIKKSELKKEEAKVEIKKDITKEELKPQIVNEKKQMNENKQNNKQPNVKNQQESPKKDNTKNQDNFRQNENIKNVENKKNDNIVKSKSNVQKNKVINYNETPNMPPSKFGLNKDYNFKIDDHAGVPNQQRDKIQNIVIKRLIDDDYTPNEAEEFKKKIREATFGLKVKNPEDYFDTEKVINLIKNDSDFALYEKVVSGYRKIYNHAEEQRMDLYDENYKKIKNIRSPPINEDNPTKIQLENNKSTGRKWVPHKNVESINLSYKNERKQKEANITYNYNKEEYKYYDFVKNEAIEERKRLDKNLENYKKKVMPLDTLDKATENAFFKKFGFDKNNKEQMSRVNDILNIFKTPVSDLINFDVWRTFDHNLRYYKNLSEPNFKKCFFSPDKLIKQFSFPGDSLEQDNTGHYFFQDMDLNIYLLYDFKQTTMTYGENESDDYYQQQIDKQINPRFHLHKSLTPKEFWNTNEEREFRVMATPYSNIKRFITYMKLEVS